MKRFRVKRWEAMLLGAVLTIVFFGALFLRASDLYISPDETASAFFVERYAETGMLSVFEGANLAFDDRLHPRSVRSIHGRLVPGSFLGLPMLYGAVVAVAGEWILPFITPLIAVLAVLAWYGIQRRLFSERTALLGSVLLAMHAGWWYYTARGLMHNVLFVALLLFAAYVLVARPAKRLLEGVDGWHALRSLDVALSGMFLGLALVVRSSEVIWIVAAVLFGGIWFRKHIHLREVALFGCAMLLALTPMFFLNRSLYGGALSSGYTAQADLLTNVSEEEFATIEAPETEDVSRSLGDHVEGLLLPAFPFGIELRATARHVGYYGLALFWWMGMLALIGVPLLFSVKEVPKRERHARRGFFWLAAGISAWLAVMYGSWTFFDNPDVTQITIANSYVRYWLPIYVLMTPFAAMAVEWISARGRTEFAKRLVIATLIIACAGLNIRATFFQQEDGLVAVAATLSRSEEIKEVVLEKTEQEAVIIVDRADKLFFPDRRVLYPLRDESTYALMPSIVRRLPLYYYGVTFPEKDMTYLNTRKLKELGLKIELIETFDEESLYRIFQP